MKPELSQHWGVSEYPREGCRLALEQRFNKTTNSHLEHAVDAANSKLQILLTDSSLRKQKIPSALRRHLPVTKKLVFDFTKFQLANEFKICVQLGQTKQFRKD